MQMQTRSVSQSSLLLYTIKTKNAIVFKKRRNMYRNEKDRHEEIIFSDIFGIEDDQTHEAFYLKKLLIYSTNKTST